MDGALLHNVGASLGQEAGCASLREVDDSPALEGHFGGSLDIDSKDQHTEAEAEELQGTCPEQPGVIHHEQDRQTGYDVAEVVDGTEARCRQS